MNTTPNAQPDALPDVSAEVPTDTSLHRLARNRATLATWLEQDQARRAQPHGWAPAIELALPWIQSLARSPVASMALGALTQAVLQPADPAQPTQAVLVEAGLGLVRRHPWRTLGAAAVAGAALYWSRSKLLPTD